MRIVIYKNLDMFIIIEELCHEIERRDGEGEGTIETYYRLTFGKWGAIPEWGLESYPVDNGYNRSTIKHIRDGFFCPFYDDPIAYANALEFLINYID